MIKFLKYKKTNFFFVNEFRKREDHKMNFKSIHKFSKNIESQKVIIEGNLEDSYKMVL